MRGMCVTRPIASVTGPDKLMSYRVRSDTLDTGKRIGPTFPRLSQGTERQGQEHSSSVSLGYLAV